MNKRKYRWKWAVLFTVLLLALARQETGMTVQAKTYNLLETMQAKESQPGKWVKNKKGYRYRLTATKKYAKNTWLKAGKNLYYVNKKGYRVTGFKTYRKNRYYLDAKGRLRTGWVKKGQESYYFSKETGAMATGWRQVGKKQYFFGLDGAMQKNLWVEGRYLGKRGNELAAKRIFVGDSRTVGMRNTVNSSDTWLAAWGKGYDWFDATARPELEKKLKKYPYSAVILNLGVNDLANVQLYADAYRALMNAFPQARFYFMSVNPVEEQFLRKNGFGGREPESIAAFNEVMKELFGSRYIDTHTWLLEKEYVMDLPEGHGTVDGLHYTSQVYEFIYQYVASRGV